MLTNKVVVIIGANGLLGKEFVKTIQNYNGIVVKSDVIDSEHNCNITKKKDIIKLINYTKKKYNKIDAVVNTSYPRSKNYGKKFEAVNYKDFCENINLHLGGYFLFAQQFAEFFKKQGYGNIINIASVYGIITPRFEIYKNTSMTMPIEYNVVKHGIISMTKYIAKYYKGHNIRANCISPGGILNNQPKEFIEKYNQLAINKGMLNEKDLGGTLIYLLSNMSEYVNGQNIVVDDGFTL